MLSWPLLVLVAGIVWTAVVGDAAVFFLAPLASIASAINTPIVVAALARNHLPSSQRSRSMFKNASRFGLLALLLTMANTIVAVVGIIMALLAGACIILVSR